jgi:hypothetical protein
MVGNAHPTGVTRLKLWADKVLENTISNIFNDRFTHSFSLVVPLHIYIPAFKKSRLACCLSDG